MGKQNKQGEPSSDANQRINFLYQASIYMATLKTDSKLPSYYGYLTKEIARKIVRKLHPNIKRSLCSACNTPLTVAANTLWPKIIPCKRRRNNKPKRKKANQNKIYEPDYEWKPCMLSTAAVVTGRELKISLPNHRKVGTKNSRMSARERQPNRLSWNCPSCGYTKSFLQRPSHNVLAESNNMVTS